ncbi:MAG: hypothetical protein IMZ64_01760, partial [Bacteroidetes bacterium]|nr:hypothetical protein [Bacteroidota bacterium]
MDPKEKKDTEVKNDKELLLQEIKGLIADSTKETVSAKDLNETIEAINKSIAEKLDNAGIKALKESVDKLISETTANAAAIKAMNETAVKKASDKPMSFKDALVAAVMAKKDVPGLLTEKNDDFGKRLSLKDYFTSKGNQHSPEFVINKTLVDMLESSIVGSNAATIRLTDLDPQRVGIPLTLYP